MRRVKPMTRLYQRLSQFGIDKEYVKTVALPAWWDDTIADDPAGRAQTISLLARNLNLDTRSLLDDASPVRCRNYGNPKHKMPQSVSEGDIHLAECLAVRIAQLAAQAIPIDAHPIPKDPHTIRRAILSSRTDSVHFEVLLDYCWRHGIPVLHVSRFPRGAKKMDALVAKIQGRPVIVLSRNNDQSAWLLFHLAHEMGHIASGHLDGDGLLVDEEVKGKDNDAEEAEANRFALELLCGREPIPAHFGPVTGASLANLARQYGAEHGVDPGYIALRHGYSTGRWAVANTALKRIEPRPHAVATIHAKMLARLDLERLPNESHEYILRITGAGSRGESSR